MGAGDDLPEAATSPKSVGEIAIPEARPAVKKGGKLSPLDVKAKGKKSWETSAYGDSSKTVWDGADLSGMSLTFSDHNFGYNDSMKKVNFSGSTINTSGNQPFLFVDLTGTNFSGATLNFADAGGRMNAFRDAKLTSVNFSGITWAVSTEGRTDKLEFFFSGGPGTTSVADKQLAVTFEGADLSRIVGPAKAAMIQHLGKFDGSVAIGAKYNASTLKKSGWTAAELDAAGWQRVR